MDKLNKYHTTKPETQSLETQQSMEQLMKSQSLVG